ncbi:MAG: 3-phosphoshikimate 1-carboxyvinyltransferase [Eubacteriales bacterium]|nr:3-phosphoshikimate 1-carboxyvinyltransferase [Eubacteriales bacterium]
MEFKRTSALKGEVTVPGDKSISHRAVMFGSVSEGTTEITNFLNGADCLSTIDCFRRLGIEIETMPKQILIHGKGLHGLKKPNHILDVGNSGTTTRLLCGILSGQPFESIVDGDASIRTRPMKRIITPLSQMGAEIASLHGNDCAPLRIRGTHLKSIAYVSPVASAQVKSAILLAGLYADGETSVTEPALSRNHSELMLNYFGADVTTHNTTVTIQPDPVLVGQKVNVPGDISSAAYFIAAALTIPHSEILIKNVGINPTRDGILRVCKAMGADITLENCSYGNGEPTADLLVRYTPNLKATVIGGDLIPTLIDELPMIAILACFADGTTIIKDAQELKVKESNRIDLVARNLSAMGAKVIATDDGLIIEGGYPLHGAAIETKYDHRIAMSFAVAALTADSVTQIDHAECVNISYPDFYHHLASLTGKQN